MPTPSSPAVDNLTLAKFCHEAGAQQAEYMKPSVLNPQKVQNLPVPENPPELKFAVLGMEKCATSSLRTWLKEMGLRLPARDAWTLNLDGKSFEYGWIDAAVCNVCVLDAMLPSWVYAHRMTRVYPNLRLASIVRDPVERAWSHWRMRAPTDPRSAEEAFDDCLAERWHENPWLNDYVSAGEYDRILSYWEDRDMPVRRFSMEWMIRSVGYRVAMAEYLGIPTSLAATTPFPHERRGDDHGPIPSSIKQRLEEHYAA